MKTLLLLAAAVGSLLTADAAHAQALPPSLEFYFGQDKPSSPYGGSDASPASERQINTAIAGGEAAAARAAFDGGIRLTTVGIESFESGSFTANNTSNGTGYLTSVPVSFQGSGDSPQTSETIGGTFRGTGAQYSIRSDRAFGTFPTAGTQFLASTEGNIAVTFDQPVSAFGFYGTDIGEGSTQKIRLELYTVGAVTPTYSQVVDGISATSGGILFFGFTDQATLYERVDITTLDSGDAASSEYFGFDSFITADVNQVAGAEFADPINAINDPADNVAGAASAVEGEAIRLLYRTDGTGAGTVTVALVGGTGTAADIDGFTTQTLSIADGDNIAALPVGTTDDAIADDGETLVFEITGLTGSFADSYAVGDQFTLTIGDPLATFSQGLAPAPAVEGQTATYTVTVNNAGRGTTTTGIAFSTALPAGLPVASPSNVASSCGGTAGVSGQTLTVSGASVAPEATCTITVDVTPTEAGTEALAAVAVTTANGRNQAPAATATVDRGVSFAAASANAAEGDAVTLGATLSSAAPSGGFTVDVALTAGAAADLDAYAVQTITFAAGTTTGSAQFTVADDGLREGAETLTFGLGNPSAGLRATSPSSTNVVVAASSAAASVATGTGQSVSGGTVSQTVAEGGAVTIALTLSDAAVGDETVDVVLTAGQAADVETYTGTLAFVAGETTASVTITVAADGQAEAQETVTFDLQNPANVDLGVPGTFVLTIPESGVNVAFDAASTDAAEGDAVTFAATLSGPAPAGGVTIDVALPTASQADFASYAAQTLTFAAGETAASVGFTVAADGLREDAESFTVAFENASARITPSGQTTAGLEVAASLATGTVAAGPDQTVSGTKVVQTVNEGGSITITATLSDDAVGDETVDVVLTAGQAADVETYTETLAFVAGETTASVTITVAADGQAEAEETVTFALQNAANLDLGAPGTFVLTIPESGVNVAFDVASTDAAEGDAATFAATLSGPAPAGGVTIDVALTAGASADFTSYAVQTMTFAEGATTASVGFTVAADGFREDAESFTFGLENASARISPSGQTTAGLEVAASLARGAVVAGFGQAVGGGVVSMTVEEDGSLTVTVALSDDAVGDETVDIVLTTGAPTTGSAADLAAYSETLSFAPGATLASRTIGVLQDGRAEGEEVLRFVLANAQNLDLGTVATFDLTVGASAAGASAAPSAADGAEGGSATITVTSGTAADGDTATVTFNAASSTGTSADLDGFTSATVTFADGVATLDVPVSADGLAEQAEAFVFDISGTVLDPEGDASFTLTVARSNAGAVFERSALAAQEGETATFVVTLTSPALGDETVDVVLTSGDPADLDGFTAATLTFAAGETMAALDIPITDDGTPDPDETFVFALQGETFLDLGTPATSELYVGKSGAFVSFALTQDPAHESVGTYALGVRVDGELRGPTSVLVTLLSGDSADVGGFTEQRVDLPWGTEQRGSVVVVDIPITGDRLREGRETFVFGLTEPIGNAPEGVDLSYDTFGLIVIDDDGNDGTDVATVPTGEGIDGGIRLFGMPVGGLTVAEVAAAAAGDGPAPTVYVVDPATGALVVPDPALVLDAGQAVYVDVAPGAPLTFTGTAPTGPVTFVGAADAETGRTRVVVSNPAGGPIDLATLAIEGGVLADGFLILDPATGAFVPLSLSAFEPGEALLPAFGVVIVEVVASGAPADVRVTLDPADAATSLTAGALGADACRRAPGDTAVVCLALRADDRDDAGDRAVVRLRPEADDVRGLAATVDRFDLEDIASPDDLQLTLPGGPAGDLALAAASVAFETTLTVPLTVAVDGPGAFTLALAREVLDAEGQRLDVVLLDRGAEVAFDSTGAYVFDVAPEEAVSDRFALRVGRPTPVASGRGPSLVDRVGSPFPNPSAGTATVEVEVARAQAVRVTVYDAVGRAVLVPFDGHATPGEPLRIALDATGLARGLYVVHVAGETVREARRLTVVR